MDNAFSVVNTKNNKQKVLSNIFFTVSSAFLALLLCSVQVPVETVLFVVLTAAASCIVSIKTDITDIAFNSKRQLLISILFSVYLDIRCLMLFTDTKLVSEIFLFTGPSYADTYRLFPYSEYLYAALAFYTVFILTYHTVHFLQKNVKTIFFTFTGAIESFFRKFKNLKVILPCAIALVLSAAIGMAALTAVYTIPVEKIKPGITESADSFYQEDAHKQVIPNVTATTLDNFVDAMMMTIAVFDSGETALVKAVKNFYCFDVDSRDEYLASDELKMQPIEFQKKLYNILHDIPSDLIAVEYGRYWHGYQVILKPLLTVCSYMQIRIINAALQIVLLAVLLYVMYKRNMKRFILPFALSLLSICVFIFPLSLQYSWLYYITLIASIAVLAMRKTLSVFRNRLIFFFVLGIITIYFDLLTCPLIAVCIPLILLAFSEKRKENYAKKLLICFGFFLAGYFLMWAAKWLIFILVTREGSLLDLDWAILKRIAFSKESAAKYSPGGYTYFNVLFNNLKDYLFDPAVVPVIGLLVTLVIKSKNKKLRYDENTVLTVMVLSALPFIWYLVLNNHSYVHSRYTFRILIIPLLAVLFMLTERLYATEAFRKKKKLKR